MGTNKYLYEIIEDYKDASSHENKDEIFNDFCSTLWKCKNKRRTYTKTIKFKVRDDLLNSDIGEIFNTWSIIEFKGYKSMSSESDWCSLVRQKINNLYTKYFDKEVILNKEYMDLLKTPKNLYYRWTKGGNFDIDTLTNTIDNAISNAINVKEKYQRQKMELSWSEYKDLIEAFLRKIFDSCMTINEYENKYGVPNYLLFNEFSTEDNFYIKYICKSLELHIRNYQKEYYNLKRGRNKEYKHCDECGALIEIKNKKDYSTKYCKSCKDEKIKESKRKWWNNNH